MIDPVSLAVMALVRGLTAGAQAAGREAGADAYQALKKYLLAKYQKSSPQIARLEADPKSVERQEELAQSLRDSGAEQDAELQTLAGQLMDVIEQGVLTDALDKPRYEGGVRAVGQVLAGHIQTVSEIRSSYRLNDDELLSSTISQAPNVPAALRQDVVALHARIRQIIEQVAENIEGQKNRETAVVAENLPGLNERERATRLVDADKKIRVSYESLRLAVGFFGDLNSQILERIEHEPSVERQAQMMFGNAVTIYELADFVIEYIEAFKPAGFQELDELHQETLARIAKARADQQRLVERAKNPGIEPDVREGILEDSRNRERALSLFQDEWERYVTDTRQFHNRVNEVQSKVPTLELIRENARIQLTVLELVSMLRFLRQNADAVRATVETLQRFKLAPLTPNRVRRLLGPASAATSG